MNYRITAYRIFSINDNTQLESYEKNCPNYQEALKERERLQALETYTHIRINKIKEPHLF